MSERNQNVQMLRFVAAGLVVATHVTFYVHERVDAGFPVWHGGSVGVPIFFVISGYVMYLSGGNLPRNSQGAQRFLCRRIARVIPLYWLITSIKIAIALTAPALVLHNYPSIESVLGSYVLLPMTNGEGEVRPLHGVAWTLLHEMFFYYLYALALALRQSPFVFCSLCIVLLAVVGQSFPNETAMGRIYLNEINLHFVAGMSLAALFRRGEPKSKLFAVLLLAAGVAMMSVLELRVLRFSWFGHFDVGVVFFVGGFLLLRASILPEATRLAAELGNSSYSLYMLHPILAPALCLVIFRLEPLSNHLGVLVVFLSCVGLAHWVYLRVESPLNERARRMLERMVNRRLPATG